MSAPSSSSRRQRTTPRPGGGSRGGGNVNAALGWWSTPDRPSINPRGMSTESEWTIPLDCIFLAPPPTHTSPSYYFSVATEAVSGSTSYPGISSTGVGGCSECGLRRATALSSDSLDDDERSPQRAFGVPLVESNGERRVAPAPSPKRTQSSTTSLPAPSKDTKGKKRSGGGLGTFFSCCTSGGSGVKEPKRKLLAAHFDPTEDLPPVRNGYPETHIERAFSAGFRNCSKDHTTTTNGGGGVDGDHLPPAGILPPLLLHNAIIRDSLGAAVSNGDSWEALLDRATSRLLPSPNVSPPAQYWSRHNFAGLIQSSPINRGGLVRPPVLSDIFALGGGDVSSPSRRYNDSLQMHCVLGRSRLLPPLESVHIFLDSLTPQARLALPELLLGCVKGRTLDPPPPREPIGVLNQPTPSRGPLTPSEHALNLLSVLDMAYNSATQQGEAPPEYVSPMSVRREMLSMLLSVVKSPDVLPPAPDGDERGGIITAHAEDFYTSMFGKFAASDNDDDDDDSSSSVPASPVYKPPTEPAVVTSNTHRVVVPPSPSLWERQCCYCIEMLTEAKEARQGPSRRRVAEAFVNAQKPTVGFLNFMPLSEALSRHVVSVPDPANPNVQVLCLKFKVSVFVAFSDELHGAIYRLCASRSLPRYGLRGLKNHGATCYLNVVLQIFYHSRYLRRDVNGSRDIWETLSDLASGGGQSAVVPAVDSTDLPPGSVQALMGIFQGLAGVGREGEMRDTNMAVPSPSVVVTKPLLRALGISPSVQFDAHEALSEFFLNGFLRHVAESLFAWPVENVTQALSDPNITSAQKDVLYEFSLCVQGVSSLEDAFRKEFRGVEKRRVAESTRLWIGTQSTSEMRDDRRAALKRWGFGEEDVLEYAAPTGQRVPAVRFQRLPLSGGTKGSKVIGGGPTTPLLGAANTPNLYSPSCSPSGRSQGNVDMSDIQLSVETPPRAAKPPSHQDVTPQRPPTLPLAQMSNSIRQQRSDNPPMIIVHTKRFDMYARKVHATQRYPLVLTWRFLLSLATDPEGESAPSSATTPPPPHAEPTAPIHSPPEQQLPAQRFDPTESVKRAVRNGHDGDSSVKRGVGSQFSFTLNSTGKGMSSTLREGPGIEDDQDYVLYAVVAHHGVSMESGHYTCYLRFATEADRSSPAPTEDDCNVKGVTFFHFDDEAVYPVPAETMLKGISGAFWECPGTSAYLLFYVRRSEWLTM